MAEDDGDRGGGLAAEEPAACAGRRAVRRRPRRPRSTARCRRRRTPCRACRAASRTGPSRPARAGPCARMPRPTVSRSMATPAAAPAATTPIAAPATPACASRPAGQPPRPSAAPSATLSLAAVTVAGRRSLGSDRRGTRCRCAHPLPAASYAIHVDARNPGADPGDDLVRDGARRPRPVLGGRLARGRRGRTAPPRRPAARSSPPRSTTNWSIATRPATVRHLPRHQHRAGARGVPRDAVRVADAGPGRGWCRRA